MTDPALIPWWSMWTGLVLAVSGAVLALHGFGQRRPSKVADVGGTIVAVGVVLMLGTALTNGVGLIVSAFHAAAEQRDAQYRSPDR